MNKLKNQVPYTFLNKFLNAATQLKIISNNEEKVIKVLRSYMGHNGSCYPSIDVLAFESGVAPRTIRNIINRLKYIGWLSWTNTRHGRRQGSNHYQFRFSEKFMLYVINKFKEIKKKGQKALLLIRRQRVLGSPFYIIKKALNKVYTQVKKQNNHQSHIQILCEKYKDDPKKLKLVILGQLNY